MALATVVILVIVVVTAVWAYSKARLSYWSVRGVPTVRGALPFLGHSTKLLSRTHSKWVYLDEVSHEANAFSLLSSIVKNMIFFLYNKLQTVMSQGSMNVRPIQLLQVSLTVSSRSLTHVINFNLSTGLICVVRHTRDSPPGPL